MADQVEISGAAPGEPGHAGESIHLPGPSYQPVLVALGLTLAIVGVVLSLILVVLGLLITIVAVTRWIRDTRTEMSELPLEH